MLLLFYVSPLIINAALGIFLISFVLRHRLTPSAQALMAIIVGATLWSSGYALEFLSPTLAAKLFWAKFQYFGITTIPLAWFTYAFQYLGSPGWWERPRKQQLALGAVPMLTLVLVWTNELHGWIWSRVELQMLGRYPILDFEHGPFFWVQLAFAYILLLVGSVRLVAGLLGSFRVHRLQTSLALAAILVPWLGNLVYISGLNPVPRLDWTPFSFTLSGLLFTLSLFRYRLINILPIAQRAVFAGVPDCMIVLDSQDCIVDLNASARKMIGHSSKELFRKPVAEVLPEYAQRVSAANLHEELRVEYARGEEPDQQFFELRVTPLTGTKARPVGRLVVCHEITQHKRAQSMLEQAVAERTVQLTQAVEQLQDELAQRTLAERRFERVVESAPDAMILLDQSGSIRLANPQAEQLSGYAREELLEQDIEFLIPNPFRHTLRSQAEKFFKDPDTRHSTLRMEISVQCKDGSQVPVGISLGILETAGGFGVVCSLRDISDRKKAEQDQSRLLQEIRASHEQLRLMTARLQEVEELERRKIAGELHDRAGQNLAALHINMQLIQNQLSPESEARVLHRLADSIHLLEETNRQVREVMAELHPPVLHEFGLVAALHWYAGIFCERTGVAARVIGEDFNPLLPPKHQIVLFRMVQEALNNVARHAQATRVMILVDQDVKPSPGAGTGRMASLVVEDDGVGFDIHSLPRTNGKPHWGILNMQERAASIEAELSIDSAPGQGTLVKITFWR